MKETELLNIVDSYILHITTCKVFRDKIKERILQTISEKIDEELDNIFGDVEPINIAIYDLKNKNYKEEVWV